MKNKHLHDRIDTIKASVLLSGLLYNSTLSAITIEVVDHNTITKFHVEAAELRTPPFHSVETKKGEHQLYFYDKDGGSYASAAYRCRSISRTPIPSSDLPSNQNDPRWIAYTESLANIINSCSWTQVSGEAHLEDTETMTLLFNDGHPSSSGNTGLHANLPTPVLPGEPISCSASILSHMSFGKLGLGSTTATPALASIELMCDSAATVHLAVNNDTPLETGDGARVSFNYKNSHAVSKDQPYGISIEGTLDHGPSAPGEYTWYVPIVIKYE